MTKNYIGEIFAMLDRLDETDKYFIRQIHAILFRHEEKKKENALSQQDA